MLNVYLLEIAIAGYLVAGLLHLLALFRPYQAEHLLVRARWVAIGGCGVHTVAIVARWFEHDCFPLCSPVEYHIFMSWAIIALFLVLGRGARFEPLGAFALPLALAILLPSVVLIHLRPPTDHATQPATAWLLVHIGASFFAVVSFGLAALTGALYLTQRRLLKSRLPSPLSRSLPPLSALDAIGYRALVVGMVLLSIGIVTGGAFAEVKRGSPFDFRGREIAVLVTWVIYAVLLGLRASSGWRGRKASYMAIAGFLVIVVAFMGARLI